MANTTDRLIKLIDMVSSGNVSDFANKTGIKQATLHNYTKGRFPSGESFFNICNKLKVNINWLLCDNGPIYIKEGGSETLDADPEINDLLQMTREVLRSDTEYSKCLGANARSFHNAIKTENRLQTMEFRLNNIEKKIQEEPPEPMPEKNGTNDRGEF